MKLLPPRLSLRKGDGANPAGKAGQKITCFSRPWRWIPAYRHAVHQRGAALLAAMLTVTLVATFAAAALWQQFRSVEVESAERARVQSGWILTAALDWARLILREDARAGGADHLTESWAVPLNEARLSSFLSADKNVDDSVREAFLSGQVTDLQGRLNVANLLEGDTISETGTASFVRLFSLLGIPPEQLTALTSGLLEASKNANQSAIPLQTSMASFMPQRVEQLVWLGLTPASLATLAQYITLLPARTSVNLNTASVEVLYASTPGLELADAQRLVDARENSHFRTLGDANKVTGSRGGQFNEGQHAVASRFFEVRGRLRLDQTVVQERSVLQRDGLTVRTLWRERGVVADSFEKAPTRPLKNALP